MNPRDSSSSPPFSREETSIPPKSTTPLSSGNREARDLGLPSFAMATKDTGATSIGGGNSNYQTFDRSTSSTNFPSAPPASNTAFTTSISSFEFDTVVLNDRPTFKKFGIQNLLQTTIIVNISTTVAALKFQLLNENLASGEDDLGGYNAVFDMVDHITAVEVPPKGVTTVVAVFTPDPQILNLQAAPLVNVNGLVTLTATAGLQRQLSGYGFRDNADQPFSSADNSPTVTANNFTTASPHTPPSAATEAFPSPLHVESIQVNCKVALSVMDVGPSDLAFIQGERSTASREISVSNKSAVPLRFVVRLQTNIKAYQVHFHDFDSPEESCLGKHITLKPHEARKLMLNVTTNGTPAGNYHFTAQFDNLRDYRNQMLVTASVTVTSQDTVDLISVDEQRLEFGDLYYGQQSRRIVTITNTFSKLLPVAVRVRQPLIESCRGKVTMLLANTSEGPSESGEEIVIPPSSEVTVAILYTPSPDWDASANKSSNTKEPLSAKMKFNLDLAATIATGLESSAGKGARRQVSSTVAQILPLWCKAHLHKSQITLSHDAIRFGDVYVSQHKVSTLTVENLSPLPGRVSVKVHSKIISIENPSSQQPPSAAGPNASGNPHAFFDLAPFGKVQVRLRIAPQRVNPEYRKQLTIVNMHAPQQEFYINIESNNMAPEETKLHDAQYTIERLSSIAFPRVICRVPYVIPFRFTSRNATDVIRLSLRCTNKEINLFGIRKEEGNEETEEESEETEEGAADRSIPRLADEGTPPMPSPTTNDTRQSSVAISESSEPTVRGSASIPNSPLPHTVAPNKPIYNPPIADNDIGIQLFEQSAKLLRATCEAMGGGRGLDGVTGAAQTGKGPETVEPSTAILSKPASGESGKSRSSPNTPRRGLSGNGNNSDEEEAASAGEASQLFPAGVTVQSLSTLRSQVIDFLDERTEAIDSLVLAPLQSRVVYIVFLRNVAGCPSWASKEDCLSVGMNGMEQPRIVRLSYRLCETQLDISQKSRSFGDVDLGDKKVMKISVRNTSETPLWFSVEKSTSVASLRIGSTYLKAAYYDFVKGSGVKELDITIAFGLRGAFRETLTISNLLDPDNSVQLQLKADVKKVDQFEINPESVVFEATIPAYPICMTPTDEEQPVPVLVSAPAPAAPVFPTTVRCACKITVTNTSKSRRDVCVRLKESLEQLLNFGGGEDSNLIAAELQLDVDESGQRGTATKSIEERIEALLQKLKIAQRKGKTEKIALVTKNIEKLRAALTGASVPADDATVEIEMVSEDDQGEGTNEVPGVRTHQLILHKDLITQLKEGVPLPSLAPLEQASMTFTLVCRTRPQRLAADGTLSNNSFSSITMLQSTLSKSGTLIFFETKDAETSKSVPFTVTLHGLGSASYARADTGGQKSAIVSPVRNVSAITAQNPDQPVEQPLTKATPTTTVTAAPQVPAPNFELPPPPPVETPSQLYISVECSMRLSAFLSIPLVAIHNSVINEAATSKVCILSANSDTTFVYVGAQRCGGNTNSFVNAKFKCTPSSSPVKTDPSSPTSISIEVTPKSVGPQRYFLQFKNLSNTSDVLHLAVELNPLPSVALSVDVDGNALDQQASIDFGTVVTPASIQQVSATSKSILIKNRSSLPQHVTVYSNRPAQLWIAADSAFVHRIAGHVLPIAPRGFMRVHLRFVPSAGGPTVSSQTRTLVSGVTIESIEMSDSPLTVGGVSDRMISASVTQSIVIKTTVTLGRCMLSVEGNKAEIDVGFIKGLAKQSSSSFTVFNSSDTIPLTFRIELGSNTLTLEPSGMTMTQTIAGGSAAGKRITFTVKPKISGPIKEYITLHNLTADQPPIRIPVTGFKDDGTLTLDQEVLTLPVAPVHLSSSEQGFCVTNPVVASFTVANNTVRELALVCKVSLPIHISSLAIEKVDSSAAHRLSTVSSEGSTSPPPTGRRKVRLPRTSSGGSDQLDAAAEQATRDDKGCGGYLRLEPKQHKVVKCELFSNPCFTESEIDTLHKHGLVTRTGTIEIELAAVVGVNPTSPSAPRCVATVKVQATFGLSEGVVETPIIDVGRCGSASSKAKLVLRIRNLSASLPLVLTAVPSRLIKVNDKSFTIPPSSTVDVEGTILLSNCPQGAFNETLYFNNHANPENDLSATITGKYYASLWCITHNSKELKISNGARESIELPLMTIDPSAPTQDALLSETRVKFGSWEQGVAALMVVTPNPAVERLLVPLLLSSDAAPLVKGQIDFLDTATTQLLRLRCSIPVQCPFDWLTQLATTFFGKRIRFNAAPVSLESEITDVLKIKKSSSQLLWVANVHVTDPVGVSEDIPIYSSLTPFQTFAVVGTSRADGGLSEGSSRLTLQLRHHDKKSATYSANINLLNTTIVTPGGAAHTAKLAVVPMLTAKGNECATVSCEPSKVSLAPGASCMATVSITILRGAESHLESSVALVLIDEAATSSLHVIRLATAAESDPVEKSNDSNNDHASSFPTAPKHLASLELTGCTAVAGEELTFTIQGSSARSVVTKQVPNPSSVIEFKVVNRLPKQDIDYCVSILSTYPQPWLTLNDKYAGGAVCRVGTLETHTVAMNANIGEVGSFEAQLIVSNLTDPNEIYFIRVIFEVFSGGGGIASGLGGQQLFQVLCPSRGGGKMQSTGPNGIVPLNLRTFVAPFMVESKYFEIQSMSSMPLEFQIVAPKTYHVRPSHLADALEAKITFGDTTTSVINNLSVEPRGKVVINLVLGVAKEKVTLEPGSKVEVEMDIIVRCKVLRDAQSTVRVAFRVTPRSFDVQTTRLVFDRFTHTECSAPIANLLVIPSEYCIMTDSRLFRIDPLRVSALAYGKASLSVALIQEAAEVRLPPDQIVQVLVSQGFLPTPEQLLGIPAVPSTPAQPSTTASIAQLPQDMCLAIATAALNAWSAAKASAGATLPSPVVTVSIEDRAVVYRRSEPRERQIVKLVFDLTLDLSGGKSHAESGSQRPPTELISGQPASQPQQQQPPALQTAKLGVAGSLILFSPDKAQKYIKSFIRKIITALAIDEQMLLEAIRRLMDDEDWLAEAVPPHLLRQQTLEPKQVAAPFHHQHVRPNDTLETSGMSGASYDESAGPLAKSVMEEGALALSGTLNSRALSPIPLQGNTLSSSHGANAIALAEAAESTRYHRVELLMLELCFITDEIIHLLHHKDLRGARGGAAAGGGTQGGPSSTSVGGGLLRLFLTLSQMINTTVMESKVMKTFVERRLWDCQKMPAPILKHFAICGEKLREVIVHCERNLHAAVSSAVSSMVPAGSSGFVANQSGLATVTLSSAIASPVVAVVQRVPGQPTSFGPAVPATPMGQVPNISFGN